MLPTPASALFVVHPQRFHRRSTVRSLLAPAGDESLARPRGSRQDAFELKDIAPLRLGQGGASMNAELSDVESDLAQLAYHENLEVFRRELRQFGHGSTLRERRTQTLRRRAQGRQVRSR